MIVFKRSYRIWKNFRDNSTLKIFVGATFSFISISKNILFGWMPVKIEKKGNFMSFLNADYVILNCLNFRKKLKISCMKVSIQVLTKNTSTMVTQKYSIWVDHRYNVEVIVVSQKWGLQYSWNKTLKCKIGDSFTRMSSRQDYYGLFVIVTMKSFLMGLCVHSFTFFFLLSLMELMRFSTCYTYRHDIKTR